MPLEHGNQRSTTAQATVTGAGSALITKEKKSSSNARITYVTPGKIQDLGVKDMANMGAAMAPAAFNTIAQHLTDTNRDIDYYDVIITGDLGEHGSKMLHDLFELENIDISKLISNIINSQKNIEKLSQKLLVAFVEKIEIFQGEIHDVQDKYKNISKIKEQRIKIYTKCKCENLCEKIQI